MATRFMPWQPARQLLLQLLAMARRTFLQPAVCDADAGLIGGAVALAEEVAGYQRGHAYGAFDGREVQDTCNMRDVSHHQKPLQTCPAYGCLCCHMVCRCKIISLL